MVKFWITKVLHENHIVLRDLKAENIIKKDGIFKITNFHFAERLRISQLDEEVKGPCMGSLRLMAPEIIARKPYGLKVTCSKRRLMSGLWECSSFKWSTAPILSILLRFRSSIARSTAKITSATRKHRRWITIRLQIWGYSFWNSLWQSKAENGPISNSFIILWEKMGFWMKIRCNKKIFCWSLPPD